MVLPGERGETRVADRVVAKIASRAAWEALHGAETDDGGRRRLPPALVTRPRATAVVRERRHRGHRSDGTPYDDLGEARVRVHLDLPYPGDIARNCGAVRRRVTERVSALAGMEVPEVAVTVEQLFSPGMRRAGQGRVR